MAYKVTANLGVTGHYKIPVHTCLQKVSVKVFIQSNLLVLEYSKRVWREFVCGLHTHTLSPATCSLHKVINKFKMIFLVGYFIMVSVMVTKYLYLTLSAYVTNPKDLTIKVARLQTEYHISFIFLFKGDLLRKLVSSSYFLETSRFSCFRTNSVKARDTLVNCTYR